METMSQTGRTTTLEERVMIAERVDAGRSSPEIAAELGRPVSTVRKWRQRYLQEGRAGLTSQMGRPASGALSTFSPELRATILELRDQHPGWGPQTLQQELSLDTRFTGQKIPSRPRIAAYLKEQGRVRAYERNQDLPEASELPVERPHQEWEMDAQGVTTVEGLGKVSFINVLDVVSHTSLDSHACFHTRHPPSQAYQQVLRRAFLRYGLPEQISLDHDSVFYDNKSKSPFPGRLHLWLIGLGVPVRFIHQRPPREHARIERHHQTIAKPAFEGQTFADISALQRNLQARLLFLNGEYPSRALNGQAPWQAWPQARHSGRPFTHETEAHLLDLQRIYDYLHIGRWFRRVSINGTFSLGAQIYNVTSDLAEQTLEITFDNDSHQLLCLPELDTKVIRLDIQGLSKTELMGDAPALLDYIPYQMALPLSYLDTTL
jgi:transposase